MLIQETLLAQEIRDCSKCAVRQEITAPVPGEGPDTAQIIFIGRNPGRNEDVKGRPFIGRAGVLLDKIIRFLNFKRENCGILNTMRCYTPKNRAPSIEELDACKYWLRKELAFFKEKKLLFPCGAEAFQTFLPQCSQTISKVVGKIFKPEDSDIVTIPLFHPAYILRNPNKEIELFKLTLPKIQNYLRDKMGDLFE